MWLNVKMQDTVWKLKWKNIQTLIMPEPVCIQQVNNKRWKLKIASFIQGARGNQGIRSEVDAMMWIISPLWNPNPNWKTEMLIIL